METNTTHDDAMRDLGLRLFAALKTYTMGSGSMDKAYREMRKIEGKIDSRLIELAEHAFKVMGEFNEEIWSSIFPKLDPQNN